MKWDRRIRIGFWRLAHESGFKIKFWFSDHFESKISMDSCIGISISIRKQHFFRFLGMCHMCTGSFWRFRRALSSSEGSEFMFVHFQVKGFGLIRRTNFPAEVFIWGAATAYMDSELRFQKNWFSMKICKSLQTTRATNTHQILTLGARNSLFFFELNSKNAILEHFVISEATSVYSNKRRRQPKIDFHDFSVFFDFCVCATCVQDHFGAFAALWALQRAQSLCLCTSRSKCLVWFDGQISMR